MSSVAPEPSAPPFACHACGGTSFRVIVRGKSHEGGPGERLDLPVNTYACTSRGHGQFLQVVECTRCHLRALHPALPPAVVDEAYADVEDTEYLRMEPYRKIAFQNLVARLRRWCAPPGRLADVGCYTGLFPLAAREAGWDAWGVEPSRWAARLAGERLPGRITAGFLRDAAFASASFDVVTSWDVIEHVTDPKGELAEMARLLRPGGWLFLSTMRSDAPIVRLLGPRWPWYMEMHRFYFTPNTLGALLGATGFTVRAVEPYAHTTSPAYISWKLESSLGPLARAGGRIARWLGVANLPVKVDLGDFFLAAAQRV